MTRKKIAGIITGMSDPKVFSTEKKMRVDYYHLTMEDETGRMILLYISAASLGLYNESQSKVYYFDRKTKKTIKHRMVTPSRLVDQKVEVVGDLAMRKDGLYMSYLESIKIV